MFAGVVGLMSFAVASRDYVASTTVHIWKLSNEGAVKAIRAEPKFEDVELITEEESYEILMRVKDPKRNSAVQRLHEVVGFMKEWGSREENMEMTTYYELDEQGRNVAAPRNPVGDSTIPEIKRAW